MNSFLIGRALDYAMRSDRNLKNAKRNTPINLIQTAKIETEPTVFRPFHSFQSRLLWMAFSIKTFLYFESLYMYLSFDDTVGSLGAETRICA